MLSTWRRAFLVSFVTTVAACTAACGGGDIGSPDQLDADDDADAVAEGGDETSIDSSTDETGDMDSTPAEGGDDSTADSGSGGDSTSTDSTSGDTGVDGTVTDSGSDTGVALDTAVADTTVADTSVADTAVADTAVDSSVVDTGVVDTGTVDTGTLDSGVADTKMDAVADAPVDAALLPTLTITAPTANLAMPFTTSNECQAQNFIVGYTAPLGFNTMRWRFILPTNGKGTCTGGVAYGYFMDHTVYGGGTSGTVQEFVSLAGNYPTATGSRWWWCKAPGTTPESTVSLDPLMSASAAPPPAPGAAGVQPLSQYCYASTKGAAPTDPTQEWTFEVTLTDSAGHTVVATQKFWVYQ